MAEKSSVLLVGGGSVGAIAALNLEVGKQATVTLVCRSNYQAVKENGYNIRSCDHGTIEHWKPSEIVDTVPKTDQNGQPFDYVVCVTKNVADVPPPLSDLIRPAIADQTVIVLIQNGLNIERPMFAAFPANVVLSGVSMIGASESKPGEIEQGFQDILYVGPFRNPNLEGDKETAAAQAFVRVYGAGGKTQCEFNADVRWTRWRKLVYNACLNPICAITDLDTGRIRLSDGAVEGLVRPAMKEIIAAAKAAGHDLPPTIADDMINMDPLDLYLPPSMLQDLRKDNYIEYETILGEPLREGEKLGVPMPTLRVLYHLCQAIQWKNKEARGLVSIPPKEDFIAS
ncbi:2-dehydropantoate 2-reductase family protein [Hortaea werneckii]|nr:2-dehydropantoate 2-reductase family protein [Hortaea werneckii]KAI6989199.1 2-dehydropantoate 2-reductase family protein [Hortaea werneckii]KAI7142803.1 2-dehydropantoate 2-reductase family protein [Hortaea werneckii]KAI7170377.1 2-dehydropantoate 2-reductase family protein [Hortaea werneckii]